eukprot:scaffold322510_cov31-Tisochrysis_lutea.AAC.4
MGLSGLNERLGDPLRTAPKREEIAHCDGSLGWRGPSNQSLQRSGTRGETSLPTDAAESLSAGGAAHRRAAGVSVHLSAHPARASDGGSFQTLGLAPK